MICSNTRTICIKVLPIYVSVSATFTNHTQTYSPHQGWNTILMKNSVQDVIELMQTTN